MPGHQVMWANLPPAGVANASPPALAGPVGLQPTGFLPPLPVSPAVALTHQQLLHQGYHLVPHHNPHPHHNYGTLVLVLTIVHVAAVFYFLWLFTRPPVPKQGRKGRPAQFKCEYDYPRGLPAASRAAGGANTGDRWFNAL